MAQESLPPTAIGTSGSPISPLACPRHAEMTASERLSIEEEYTNQKLWIEDEKSACADGTCVSRCTTLHQHSIGRRLPLLDPPTAELTFLVFEGTEATLGSEECLPVPEASPSELAEQLRGICGDVNIFMCDPDHSEDYAEASGAIAAATASATDGSAGDAARSGPGSDPVTAEIMVMIADGAYRGKGLATEAVCAMMRYGALHRPSDLLIPAVVRLPHCRPLPDVGRNVRLDDISFRLLSARCRYGAFAHFHVRGEDNGFERRLHCAVCEAGVHRGQAHRRVRGGAHGVRAGAGPPRAGPRDHRQIFVPRTQVHVGPMM